MKAGRDQAVTLHAAGLCHRGRVREENQDRVARFGSALGEVFAVADGMGGHLDGGRAAELTLEVLEDQLLSLPRARRSQGCAEALKAAASEASRAVFQESARGEEGGGMGATVVLAVIAGKQAIIAHAGDSRAYLWRAGALRPLTRDHTMVQRMVDHGILTPEQARRHPDASTVQRAVGQGESVDLEVASPLDLVFGDRLMLCSDGLCGYLDDDALVPAFAEGGSVRELTGRLVDLALEAGGEDNVTVQVIDVLPAPPGEEPPKGSRNPLGSLGGRGRAAWLGLALALAAAAACLGLAWWLAS